MKRSLKIAFAAILILLIPAGILIAQDKKEQQKIKIVTADKSGTKVIIDTIFNNTGKVDSIKLQDGKVIYIGKHEGMTGALTHSVEKGEHIVVSVSTDNSNDPEIVKGYKIVAGDSVKVLNCSEGNGVIIMKEGHVEKLGGEGDNIVIVKNGKTFSEGVGGKVMMWSATDSGEKGERIIYINEGKEGLKDGEKKFDIEVTTDGSGKKVEKTSYILAKDGMTITIEGDDEAKIKEMVSVIEAKAGVVKGDKDELKEVKEVSKKTVKR